MALPEVTGPDQEKLREDLGALPRTGYVSRQLEASGITWVSQPSGIPAELMFVYKPGRGTEGGFQMSRFAGIRLFGESNVLGVAVARDEAEMKAKFEVISHHEELAHLGESFGAKVIFLGPERFSRWVEFYKRLDQTDGETGLILLDRLGMRAGEVSGLSVMSEGEFGQLRADMEKMLESGGEWLEKHKVRVVSGYFGVDMAFIDGKHRPKPVTLCHVREGREQGGLLKEWVVDQMENVIGLSYRQPGQDKFEHYAMVAQMEGEINREWGTTEKPYRLLPVSSGTVKLWRKMGMFEHPQGNFPEMEKTILRAMRLLYWGPDTLHPPVLATLGLSMPGYGDRMDFHLLDGVFLKRDKNGRLDYATIDGLVGLKDDRMVELSNVGGFITFPPEMGFKEREVLAKPAQVDFNHRTGLVKKNLWFLDDRLLDIIERQGTPFFIEKSRGGEDGDDLGDDFEDDDVEIATPKDVLSAKTAMRYYQKLGEGEKRQLWMEWYRTQPQIGANKHTLVLETAKSRFIQWLDYGSSFGFDSPQALAKIGRLPPTDNGLKRLLDNADLVAKPGIHEIWYLQMTARNWPGLADAAVIENDPIAKYVAAEIYSRMKREEIMAAFPTGIAKSILRHGGRAVRECFGEKENAVVAITPTHLHWDHVGGLPYADKSIPQVWSGPMWSAGLGMTLRAGNWRGRYTVSTDINYPRKGNEPYPVEAKDIQVYWKSGVKQRISPFSEQTAYWVDHSVPSSWLVTEVDMGGGGQFNLFNSGDWRWGEHTEKSLNMLLASGVKLDAMVMEGTRLTRDEPKYMQTISVEDVKTSFGKYLDDTAGTLRLVAVAPRSYETLYRLATVALEKGLNVALTDTHAVDELQYAAVKEIAPLDAEGFDFVLPYVLGEDRITVWAKTMTTPRAHHRAVRQIAAGGSLGLLTPERLNKPREAGRWVIFVTPYDILEDQFGRVSLGGKVSMFWSAPSVYEDDTKAFWTVNKNWLTGAPFHGGWFADFDVRGREVSFVRDKYGPKHESGHANTAQIVQVADALVGRDRKNIDFYLVHTDKPQVAEEVLKKKLGRKVKIISTFDRYDPKNPFKKPGAKFRLA